MFETWLIDLVRVTTRVVELAGVTIIVVGAFATLLLFLARLFKGADREEAVATFRSSLGRAILLGLEFLVAADIVNTVAIEPTLDSLAVLAGIVAVRTFLSFSLEAEIEGCWPWRRAAREREHA
jgi:uncharacterized membrane protein